MSPVMLVAGLLVARAAIAEVVALDDAGLFEQPHGAIDGGDRDVRIDGVGAAIELFHIGMVDRGRQHARDDAALVGHAHVLLDAEFFDPVQTLPSVSCWIDRGP